MNWVSEAFGYGAGRVWRHRWLFGVPVATFLLIATVYAVQQPDIYAPIAVVRVHETRMGDPREILPGEAAARARTILATTHDELMSKQNLVDVRDVLAPNADLESAETLRRIRGIYVFELRTANSFTLSAVHSDPEVASAAVNTVLQTFVERERDKVVRQVREEARFREKQVLDADQALGSHQLRLDKFRKEHDRTLPETRDRWRQLEAGLRLQLEIRRTRVTDLTRRLETLQDQIQETRALGPRAVVKRHQQDPMITWLESKQRRLEEEKQALERQLKVLRGRYPETRPEVRRVRQEVDALAEDVAKTGAELAKLRKNRPSAPTGPDAGGEGPNDPVLAFLEARAKDVETSLGQAKDAVAVTRDELVPVQHALTEIPRVIEAMRPLQDQVSQATEQRDELRSVYDRAAARAAWLRMRPDNEVTNYEIVQMARPTKEPVGPNRSRFLMVGAAIGAALGYGLMLLRRRFQDPSITRAEEVADLVRDAMIVSVPLLPEGPRRFPVGMAVRESLLGAWVLTCLVLSGIMIAAQANLIAVPFWLRSLTGMGA